MNPRLTEALADCLARIEQGTSPAVAIAAHPDVRDDLAPLVEAALAVRALPPRPIRPAFRAHLQADLARLEAEARDPLTWRARLLRPVTTRSTRVQILRAGAAAIAVVAALGLVVAASADSRPGDALYPLRQRVERVLGWVDRDRVGTGLTGGALPEGEGRGGATVRTGSPAVPTSVVRRARPSLVVEPAASPVGTMSPARVSGEVGAGPRIVYLVVGPTPALADPPTIAVPAPAATTHEDVPRRHPDDGHASATPEASAPATRTPDASPTPAETSIAPTDTPVPPTGPVTAHGVVRVLDGPGGIALAGVAVTVYRDFPTCPPADLAAYRVGSVITDGTGSYTLQVPSGVYRIAVGGPAAGGECYPERWYAGDGVPLAGDPCLGRVLTFDGNVSPSVRFDLVYEQGAGVTCP
jgi:hypothetical protein